MLIALSKAFADKCDIADCDAVQVTMDQRRKLRNISSNPPVEPPKHYGQPKIDALPTKLGLFSGS